MKGRINNSKKISQASNNATLYFGSLIKINGIRLAIMMPKLNIKAMKKRLLHIHINGIDGIIKIKHTITRNVNFNFFMISI